MLLSAKKRAFAEEFFRYVLVGSLAAAVDFGTLFLLRETILKDSAGGLYLATAGGFFSGLVVNYILSLTFVFRSARQTGAGKGMGGFALTALVGLVGLGLTELGMWFGTDCLGLYYLFVKVIVTGLVLIWNYLARKYFIFDRRQCRK